MATRNTKKLAEIEELLEDVEVRVTSLADYPDAPVIEEDAPSFAGNALKKAATIALYTRGLVMGEDSGLQVRALGNRPGIYSARFSGEGATDLKNNRKLLRVLRDIPDGRRQARYRCFVALADAGGIVDVVSGSCGGVIARRQRGSNGFGYDPLFLVPRYGRTFGELDPSIKARISHRARALKKFKRILRHYLSSGKETPPLRKIC